MESNNFLGTKNESYTNYMVINKRLGITRYLSFKEFSKINTDVSSIDPIEFFEELSDELFNNHENVDKYILENKERKKKYSKDPFFMQTYAILGKYTFDNKRVFLENFSKIYNSLVNREIEQIEDLEKCYKRTVLVRHNNLNIEEMDNIAYDIVHERIMIDSIDNIILLEEINYLSNNSDIVEILNVAYLYLLEIEIYKYFDIFNFNWKNNNNKNYINDKIKCLFIQKQYYKQEMISKISNKNYKDNLYEYKKFVGLLSTFSITEIYNKTYDLSIINDIYKIKYLLTVNDRDNLYIEKDGQIRKRLEEKKRYKLSTQDMLNKYKKLIEKKDFNINKLEKEKSLLQEENNIKQNTIINYANCIYEYNNLSWIKNGKVNIKLMKNYKVKMMKIFNINFPITDNIKLVIGLYFLLFIFYFQFLLIYLLIYKMVLLFLLHLNDAIIYPKLHLLVCCH